MPRGHPPSEYESNPNIDKPIEQIYAELDECTYEVFEDEVHLHNKFIDFAVLLPPTKYDGTFVKGLFYSRAVDVLVRDVPELPSLFNSIACSMWSSYPWSRRADAYFTCYPNLDREMWFRTTHSDRAQKDLIPLQDADHTNETVFAPVEGLQKDIDVLCISRLASLKNLPLVAHALRVYRSRYHRRIRMTLITGNKRGFDEKHLCEEERNQLHAVNKVLGHAGDYIDFVAHARHWTELPNYYTRAKLFVLGSLIEGKNRCINEALSCNVPVVCFRDYNQYARNGSPVLPSSGGLYSPFDPVSLAQTIHEVLENADAFSPRLAYLRENGRENFLNGCLEAMSYYRRVIPGYEDGQHLQNTWLNAGLLKNYRVSLRDFVYDNARGWGHATGLDQIRNLIGAYARCVKP
jgi:glycosyltransferase involved in cell wall biosynthesis